MGNREALRGANNPPGSRFCKNFTSLFTWFAGVTWNDGESLKKAMGGH
jgi:hypothetical protein